MDPADLSSHTSVFTVILRSAATKNPKPVRHPALPSVTPVPVSSFPRRREPTHPACPRVPLPPVISSFPNTSPAHAILNPCLQTPLQPPPCPELTRKPAQHLLPEFVEEPVLSIAEGKRILPVQNTKTGIVSQYFHENTSFLCLATLHNLENNSPSQAQNGSAWCTPSHA